MGEARRYFETPVVLDTVPENGDPVSDAPLGKTLIRLHYSQSSGNHANSAGCVVSQEFYRLRSQLIEIYQREYAAFHGARARDNEVQKAHSQSLPAVPNNPGATVHRRSRRLWNLSQASQAGLSRDNWNDKLAGVFWLIRPDERSLPTACRAYH